MNILHRRPLFSCCVVFMLSAVVGLFLDETGKYILGGLVLCGTLLYAVLHYCRRRDVYRAILAVMAGLITCLALLQSHLTFQSPTRRELHRLEQKKVPVEATIIDRRGSGGYMTTYTLDLETVNDHFTDGLALLTCYHASDLRPGNRISLKARLVPLSEAAGDGYDATALMGDGYVIGLVSEEETTIVKVLREDSDSLRVRAGKLRRTLAARLNLMTGQDAEGLPSALLLGEKTYLSDSVKRDFSRAGVSHLLAISGLHVTLLFGLLDLLLYWLFLPKPGRVVILSVCAVSYLILLGFPPSATRAVIMLGVTYLSHLMSEQADPLTSLGLAGALILAVTPYAVMDAGFWMSFLATLGLITCMPPLQEWLDRPTRRVYPLWWQLLRRDLLQLAAALLVGLTAMSFTLFIVAALVGELGLLSPVATILLTPLCGGVLVLSLLCLPLAGTFPGVILGSIAQTFSADMADLAAWMAKPSWSVVSLRHPATVPIAAAMLAVTLILLVVRLPEHRRRMVVLPILVGWMALGSVLTLHGWLTRHEWDVTYLHPSTASEALVLVSGSQGFVCDLSNGSLSAMTAAAREAKQQGATELAAYMLTHYHTRTSGALATLLEREMIRELWVPRPVNEAEYYQLLACLETAESADVPVFLYESGDTLRVFGQGMLIPEITAIKRSEQPVLLLTLDASPLQTGTCDLVYCGSAVFESSLADSAAARVSQAHTVIFGGHGPLFKAPYGENLHLSPTQAIILSANGDAAAWFAYDLSEEMTAWMGNRRFTVYAP